MRKAEKGKIAESTTSIDDAVAQQRAASAALVRARNAQTKLRQKLEAATTTTTDRLALQEHLAAADREVAQREEADTQARAAVTAARAADRRAHAPHDRDRMREIAER